MSATTPRVEKSAVPLWLPSRFTSFARCWIASPRPHVNCFAAIVPSYQAGLHQAKTSCVRR